MSHRTEPASAAQQPRLSEFTGVLEHVTLRGIAGGAAVFLGVVYAYGALIKAGELHGAGQTVSETLPLIPLEQLLVLGINEFLPLGAAAFALLLLVMWLIERLNASTISRDGARPVEAAKGPLKAKSTRRTNVLIICAVAWAIYAVVSTSWVSWLLFAEIIAGSWYASSKHTTPRGNAVFLLLAMTLFFAALAYFAPDPLPKVRLATHKGRVVTGELIATTGSTWYIGIADKQWTAIQSESIERVKVSSVEKETPESIYHAITGHRLFGLGPD